MNFFLYFFTAVQLFTASAEAFSHTPTSQTIASQTEEAFTKGIEKGPLLFSNHESNNNSLRGSVYELLNQAQSSILILSFTFSDPKIINLVNKKASEGLHVQLVIDRDHLNGLKESLHPSIQIGTRKKGEGHLHHKILVVDQSYIWLSSANFTFGSFNNSKNLAMGFYSLQIGSQLHQEALDILSSNERKYTNPLSCVYGKQLLELYVLPHYAPGTQSPAEALMNDKGKQKLISLIDNAKHHIKISVDVWTYKDASKAVINALQRGVQVDVVVGNTTEEAVKMLIQHGVQVKKGKNLHYKFMLVDNEIFLNGSPNWSMNAFSRNDESFVILYDLSDEQLLELEGVLEIAGLPISMQYN